MQDGEILVKAADENNIEKVNELLTQGVNPDYVVNNFTALMKACIKGHVKIIELLIKYKANVNLHTKRSEHPIILAAKNSHFSAVNLLVKEGVSSDTASKISPPINITLLHYAARKNNLATVKFLLDHDAYINAKDEYGSTSLMYAESSNAEEVILYLIGCGASVRIKDKDNMTIVDWVKMLNRPQRIELYSNAEHQISQRRDNFVRSLVILARDLNNPHSQSLWRKLPKVLMLNIINFIDFSPEGSIGKTSRQIEQFTKFIFDDIQNLELAKGLKVLEKKHRNKTSTFRFFKLEHRENSTNDVEQPSKKQKVSNRN